jgi:hypothetical protein
LLQPEGYSLCHSQSQLTFNWKHLLKMQIRWCHSLLL